MDKILEKYCFIARLQKVEISLKPLIPHLFTLNIASIDIGKTSAMLINEVHSNERESVNNVEQTKKLIIYNIFMNYKSSNDLIVSSDSS